MKTLPKSRAKISPFIIAFFMLLLPYALVSMAQAQEKIRTIVVSPPTKQHQLQPGDTVEGILKIINDGSESITFKTSVQDYIVNDTNGTPVLLPPNTLNKKYSAASWLGVTPDVFTVAPHQRAEISYFIQVPQDARPGGHYSAVVYTPTNTVGVTGTGASVQTQIGTLFYIDIAGEIQEQSLISRFFSNKFQEYGPVTLGTTIKNMGDLHVRPLGTIVVTDIFGRKFAEEKLTEQNIFPGAAREFENKVGKTWMIGPFTAKVMATYGRENSQTMMAQTSFWVFPWKLVVVIILLIVAAVLGYKLWKKNQVQQTHTTDTLPQPEQTQTPEGR